MDVKLKVRICLNNKFQDNLVQNLTVTEPEVVKDFLEHNPNLNPESKVLKPKLADFEATAKLYNIGYVNQLPLSIEQLNAVTDKFQLVSIVDIKLYASLKHMIGPNIPKNHMLNQHAYILNSLRKRYPNKDIFEYITVSNCWEQSTNSFFDIGPIEPGTRYRMYVDNVLITEKFYPYGLADAHQLEENVIVSLDSSEHNVQIETFKNNRLVINAVAITNIDVDNVSFKLQ